MKRLLMLVMVMALSGIFSTNASAACSLPGSFIGFNAINQGQQATVLLAPSSGCSLHFTNSSATMVNVSATAAKEQVVEIEETTSTCSSGLQGVLAWEGQLATTATAGDRDNLNGPLSQNSLPVGQAVCIHFASAVTGIIETISANYTQQ